MTTRFLLVMLGAAAVLLAANTSSVERENEPLNLPTEQKYGDRRILPLVASPDELMLETPIIPTISTTLENYPNPLTNPVACNRRGLEASYVCDPDHVLSREDVDRIEEKLARIREVSSHPCGDLGRQPFMMGVAIIRKLPYGTDIDFFGTALLDDWGLGHVECHDGVILVYSQNDGATVLKWKIGVEPYLNISKYSVIHKEIEKELARKPPGKAINSAIEIVSGYLTGDVLPPRRLPQLVVLFTCAVFVMLAYAACIVAVIADATVESQQKVVIKPPYSREFL